jgi:hypothetical protein
VPARAVMVFWHRWTVVAVYAAAGLGVWHWAGLRGVLVAVVVSLVGIGGGAWGGPR